MNFLPVQVKAPLLITHPQFRLTLPEVWATTLQKYDGRSLLLGIRPEHVSVSVPAPKNLPVQVERVEALGNETQVLVRLVGSEAPESTLQARISPDQTVRLGEEMWFAIATDKIHLFEPETGHAVFASERHF